MKIAWFSNWFTFEYKRDTGVPKNIREIPVLKELLKYGEVVWTGHSADPKVFGITKKTVNAGGILKGVPRYDKDRWGSSANYVRDIVLNYPKYKGHDLPEADCVFVRALPSFIYENLKIYLMLYRYGLRGTPVFVRDLELIMVKKFITSNRGSSDKPFGISGSDKAFKLADWNIMNKNLTILVPIPPKGLKVLRERAPHLEFKTLYFPYDKQLYPPMPVRTSQFYVTYIGNDTGRRYGFTKYFRWLPEDFVHVFGGAARQVNKIDKGFPPAFKKRLPNIAWHEPVSNYRVNMVYNMSATCMNIPRPYFNDVGFVSARFLEAVFSGAVLLLPEEFLGAEIWTADKGLIIKNGGHLYKAAQAIYNDRKLKEELLEQQREALKAECDVARDIKNIMEF